MYALRACGPPNRLPAARRRRASPPLLQRLHGLIPAPSLVPKYLSIASLAPEQSLRARELSGGLREAGTLGGEWFFACGWPYPLPLLSTERKTWRNVRESLRAYV